MIVICTKCQAKFRVADQKIGPRGAKVRCSKCQTVFLVRPEAAPDGALGPAPSSGLDLEASRAPAAGPAVRWDPAQPDAAAAPRTSPPPLPPPLPSARPADPFAAFSPAAPAAPDPFASVAASDPFAAAAAPDPFAPAARADPFAATAPSPDPFAPAPSADPFAAPPAPSDPFAASAGPGAEPPDATAAATALGDLLAAAASAAPPPAEDGLALEERPPTPPRPASSAPFDAGAEAGYEAFADAQAFDPGALDLGGPAQQVPPAAAGPLDLAGALEAAEPAAGASAIPARIAAPRSGETLPMAGAEAPAKERIPARGSRLRAVAVNAVALAALLVAAAAILALWRTEGPIDAAALRPSAVLSALRGGGAVAPFAAREVRSGLYERERAPPVLFVRGSVVSRATAPVRGVQVRVELVRDGAVLASAQTLAGAVPTPEELWSARDADALAAVATAAASRAPAEIRPGDAVPFLVAIADPPGDLAGTSLRVEAAPAGSASP